MAARRLISATLLSRLKSNSYLFQLLFLRRKTSKIFVKEFSCKMPLDATASIPSLAFSTTEEKLAEAFSQYGNVLKANIVLNKAKNRSKGFGYVTFENEEEARKAQIGMNRKMLHGRVLYVDIEQNKSLSKATDS